MVYYAGVGSRETPQDVLKTMWKIARYLADKGYTLRSGGANGADTAFENGCDSVRGSKEIFYANNNKGTLMLSKKGDSPNYQVKHEYYLRKKAKEQEEIVLARG